MLNYPSKYVDPWKSISKLSKNTTTFIICLDTYRQALIFNVSEKVYIKLALISTAISPSGSIKVTF